MLQEAKRSTEWPEWEKAIQAELNQLQEKNTWILSDLTENRASIKNK